MVKVETREGRTGVRDTTVFSNVLIRLMLTCLVGGVILAAADLLLWVFVIDPGDPGTTGYIDPIILAPMAAIYGVAIGAMIGFALAIVTASEILAINHWGIGQTTRHLGRTAANALLTTTIAFLAIGAVVFAEQFVPACYAGQCSNWGVDRNIRFFLGAVVLPALLVAGVVARRILQPRQVENRAGTLRGTSVR